MRVIFCRLNILLACLLHVCLSRADNPPKPIAKFSFDSRNITNEINGKKIKLSNTSFTKDRFGNINNSIYLFGNETSYINLGNYSELKPKTGSVSFWVYLEHPLWFGTGYKTNPFILTKRSTDDDFFESFAVYYLPETKKLMALCTKDSTNQILIESNTIFEIQKWQHLVVTYDHNFFAFYVNAKLQNSFKKDFDLEFLDFDSLLVGVTGNKKNNRFFNGSIDDILIYDKVLTIKQIDELYNAPNPNRYMIWLTRCIRAAILIGSFIALYLLVRFQLNRKMRREKIRLELQTKLLETELRVNRALMNPHFIFNSLNAIQNLILNNANEKANDYLLKFSKLIRKLLESNISESISLEIEIDILSRYLEIESLRFNEDLQHSISVDPNLHLGNSKIPIMMVQPFVENAVWHGLMNKSGEKCINISFAPHGKACVECIIEDNGVGRKVSANILMEKKPLATVFALTRLDLINKMHGLNCSIHIEDKPNYSGTIVKLILPLYNKLST